MRDRMTCSVIAVASVAAGALAGAAIADVQIFLLDDQQAEWEAALEAQRQVAYESFNTTNVFGDDVYGIDGPVFIGDVGVDSNLNPFGEGGRAGRGPGATGLTIVGPSAGFGNPETAVLAGLFPDSLDIFTVGELLTAVEFDMLSFLGSDTVSITVYNEDEQQIAQFHNLPAPPAGTRIGILATDGEAINRINIYDEAGGSEGFMGDFTAYVTGPPPPAALESIEILTGTLREGGIDDLRESDDAHVRTRSGFGARLSETHLMEMVVHADTDLAQLEALTVTVEARLNEPGGVAKLALRNWRTGAFETFAAYSIGLEEESRTFENIDAADHVRPSGAIDLSVKHVVLAPFLAFRFDSFIDHVGIEVVE